jgi:hypothetical protein
VQDKRGNRANIDRQSFQIRTLRRVDCADYPAPLAISHYFLQFTIAESAFRRGSISGVQVDHRLLCSTTPGAVLKNTFCLIISQPIKGGSEDRSEQNIFSQRNIKWPDSHVRTVARKTITVPLFLRPTSLNAGRR